MNTPKSIANIDAFLEWERKSNLWSVTLLGYPIYAGVRRRMYHLRLSDRVIDNQPGGARKTGSLVDMPRKLCRTIAAILTKRQVSDIVVVHERSDSASADPYLKGTYGQAQSFIPAYYNNRNRELADGIDLDLLRYASLIVGLPIFFLPALAKMFGNGSPILVPALFQSGDVLYYLLCRLIFRRVGVQTAALTVSYSHYPLIVAAKREKVKVVEYQHGMISRHHIGYSGLPELLKPDRLECLDEIWKEQALALGFCATCTSPKFPIATRSALPLDNKEIRALIVGQTSLTNFMQNKAKSLKSQYGTVRYRPHPTEKYENESVQICEHTGEPFGEVIRHYDLFVGVYSTALYEAWFAGKNVLILDHPMNEFFDVLQGRAGVNYEVS